MQNAYMVGPIRQELLSGIKSQAQFETLRKAIEPFEDLSLETQTYELAAKFFNACRASGISGSHIDFLICAAASTHGLPLLTLDQDFERYAKHCDFRLA